MMAGATAETRYRIEGMDCAACAVKIETAVGRLPGVSDVSVSLMAGTMRVATGDGFASATVEKQVAALGYGIAPAGAKPAAPPHRHDHGHGHDHDHAHDHDHDHAAAPGHEEAAHGGAITGPWWKSRKAILVFVNAGALGLAWLVATAVPSLGQWPFVAAILVGLIPVGRRAIAAALAGTPFSIETLMSIAVVGAMVIGASQEAATVVLLFLVGELLEGVAAGRARASIRDLAALVPRKALIEEGGGTREVDAASLALGTVILVRPGERIAADGTIVEGSAAIDEAPVTGESAPKAKGEGDGVFAGTIATDGMLRVRVTATAQDNTIARVVRLVEEAQESKAPTERFIDAFARVYTPGVLAAGLLVAVVPPFVLGADWGEWIYKGLALLLIGCPCALVISTPAAIAAGLSAGARRGLLVKGGAVLEKLRTVTAIAFDKTGTLTEGKPKVTAVVAFARSEARVLSLAAALESGSSHPLADAILAHAAEKGVPVPPVRNARAIPGKGVSGVVGGETAELLSAEAAAETVALPPEVAKRIAAFGEAGETVSVLVAGGAVAGVIAFRDAPRPDAEGAIRALQAEGIETIMLTGDHARAAKQAGDGLGIAVRAGLLPEDKQRIVRELQAAGRVVAKVGDGINDAPALAAADVGIAMGGGTDVALETADAAILHGRVGDVPDLIALSRATIGNIRQNIAVALGLKAVFLVTTLLGITGLWPAILADTGATVLVTANAMRLLAWRPSR
jgi:Cd2+/Zn2+-exporting ATPase